jgi:DNA adenine methylase
VIPPRPFLKWAGGKTQLLGQLERLYPPRERFTRYIEPFVGGGAVFFRVTTRLSPRHAILADTNAELINVYAAIKQDVEGVIRRLRRHGRLHGRMHYLETRAQDPALLSATARAARLIYLNKTCFNGLYRVNSRGQFNVPMGRYKNPSILDEDNLRAASAALRRVKLMTAGFEKILRYARALDFIYFDPPYHPISTTSSFTAYTQSSFKASDQRRLAEVFRELHHRGCVLMLSNSNASLILDLYRDPAFHVELVSAARSINSRADRRGRIPEVVVTNYEPSAGGW